MISTCLRFFLRSRLHRGRWHPVGIVNLTMPLALLLLQCCHGGSQMCPNERNHLPQASVQTAHSTGRRLANKELAVVTVSCRHLANYPKTSSRIGIRVAQIPEQSKNGLVAASIRRLASLCPVFGVPSPNWSFSRSILAVLRASVQPFALDTHLASLACSGSLRHVNPDRAKLAFLHERHRLESWIRTCPPVGGSLSFPGNANAAPAFGASSSGSGDTVFFGFKDDSITSASQCAEPKEW